MLRKSPIDFYLRVNENVWSQLPTAARDSGLARWYGTIMHEVVCRRANRQQYFGTSFLRNRAALEQMRRLVDLRPEGSTLRLTVMGCSIGAEVYSILWTVRSARPDLQVQVRAVDRSPEIVEIAAKAAYTPETSEVVGASIFARLSDVERQEIFEWQGGTATVKPWIRDGIGWHVADAADPGLREALGPQDIVTASNFLCHMEPTSAERCLRNLARLVVPGGYLFVAGVDLEVRMRVARELGWRPVTDLIKEIHEGDGDVRRDWPWKWWGLEPLDEKKRDWQLRYAVVYQLN